jgi:gamma-glutamyl hercynylcysteine S-oxide hydrolase
VCRHIAWLGEPRTLADVVLDRPHSLLRQSWLARRMRQGTINADGFGVGWYAPERAAPARYRRAVPMWTDANITSFGPLTRSSCVLGAVRNATVGMPIEETATAPFVWDGVLLSHNGRVSLPVVWELLVSEPEPPVPDSRCDAALLAAIVRARMAAGQGLAEAVAGVVVALGSRDPDARLNLLVTDGTRIVATTWAESLSYRIEPTGVTVASEPDDADEGWIEVADRQLLLADASTVTVSKLPENVPENPPESPPEHPL